MSTGRTLREIIALDRVENAGGLGEVLSLCTHKSSQMRRNLFNSDQGNLLGSSSRKKSPQA